MPSLWGPRSKHRPWYFHPCMERWFPAPSPNQPPPAIIIPLADDTVSLPCGEAFSSLTNPRHPHLSSFLQHHWQPPPPAPLTFPLRGSERSLRAEVRHDPRQRYHRPAVWPHRRRVRSSTTTIRATPPTVGIVVLLSPVPPPRSVLSPSPPSAVLLIIKSVSSLSLLCSPPPPSAPSSPRSNPQLNTVREMLHCASSVRRCLRLRGEPLTTAVLCFHRRACIFSFSPLFPVLSVFLLRQPTSDTHGAHCHGPGSSSQRSPPKKEIFVIIFPQGANGLCGAQQ